jgi:hypothetical protein
MIHFVSVIACAVYIRAYNLLPNAHCAVNVTIVAACLEYSSKGNPTLFLRFQLAQVKICEKSEKSKQAIVTHSKGPHRNLKQLFLVLTQKSKIVVCAYASKDKMITFLTQMKKKIISARK